MLKKTILVLCVGLSVSMTSALASTLKGTDLKLVDAANAVEYKINEPLAPDETIRIVANDFAFHGIETLDYGGEIKGITNENKLVYIRSNVIIVKFAKEQNQNFERMRLS